MFEAPSTTTTAVPATTPGLPSTSRRRLLAGSDLVATPAAIGLPVAALPAAAVSDTVVALYAKWRAAEDAIAAVETKQTAFRDALVSCYGEMLKPEGDVNGSLTNAQCSLVERICELQAVTKEGQAARARGYALWDAELMKPQDNIMGLFTQAIARDLPGGG
jgi:hypothetical protein